MGQGLAWWKEGWRLFALAPLAWVGIILAMALMLGCASFVPIIGGIAQSLLTPVFVGGLMLGCRALDRGESFGIGHLFAGFSAPHFTPLLTLGAISFAVGLVLVLVIMVPTAGVVSLDYLAALAQGEIPRNVATEGFGSLAFIFLVLVPILLILGMLWGMAVWFAPAAIVINGLSAIDALKASFAAGMANIGAFFVYGLIFIGLALLASIPFALGWLVFGPMFATSTYAAWRDIRGCS
jgi:uncharacterized membrane protein